MSTRVGAKTKAWIENTITKERKPFQFNPTTLDYARGATYTEISAPGMSYPNFQYVKGNARDFSVSLFIKDDPYTGKSDDYRKFLENFLPPEYNLDGYTKPPELVFCYGYFIRRCVLIDFSVSDTMFDSYLRPTESTFNLQLRQVGV